MEHFDENLLQAKDRFLSHQLPASITIPPIYCSFPWHIHPDHLKLQEMSDAWILARFANLPSVASGRDAFKADLLVKAGFHLLAALCYANSMGSRVSHIVKFVAWLFVCDNIFDDPQEMGSDLAAADEPTASIVGVLESKAAAPSSVNLVIRVLTDTATEWWNDMQGEMPATQKLRFIAKFMEYLDGTRRQISYRQAGSIPDLETFKRIRADTGAWQLCCVLIEYALGINFDEETLSHPLIRSLQSIAAYHIYWVNDLISFKKEYLEGDLLNVVVVLYCHKLNLSTSSGCPSTPLDMQAIILDVWQMIKECDQDCLRLFAEIRASSLLMGKPGMGSFLQGVANWMGGNVYWHLVSGRYGICASADIHLQPPDFCAQQHLDLAPGLQNEHELGRRMIFTKQ